MSNLFPLQWPFEYKIELANLASKSSQLYIFVLCNSHDIQVDDGDETPFFQYNVEEEFLEQLEPCPASFTDSVMRTTVRGTDDPKDEYLYVTNRVAFHN